MIGIYKILNTKNNKVYIGQTKDYDKRIREHLQYLKNNTHQNKYLQRTYNSIGEAQRITGIYNISAACRGQYKSAGGFIWRFTNG